MNPLADVRMAIDVAESDVGDQAILFQEMQVTTSGQGGFSVPTESELFLAILPRSGGTHVVDLGPADYGLDQSDAQLQPAPIFARVAFAGRTIVVALTQSSIFADGDVCADHPRAICGAATLQVSIGGRILARQVAPGTDANFDPFDVDALVEPDGGIDLMYGHALGGSSYEAVVQRIGKDGGSELGRLPVAANTGSTFLGAAGGELYLVDDRMTDASNFYPEGFDVRRVSDGHTDTLYFADAGIDCQPPGDWSFFPLIKVHHEATDDSTLTFEYACLGHFGLVTYAPGTPPRWQQVASVARFESAALVPSNADWSVAEYVYGDSVPAGGVVVLAWGDGGTADSAYLTSTVAPSYLWHVEATRTADGLPSTAYSVKTDLTAGSVAPLYSARVRR